MYPKFIELHAVDLNEKPFSINVAHIMGFSDTKDGYGLVTAGGKDVTQMITTESYDELKALIEDIGCLIKKADPRLDTEHPLTMDDLSHMVGEPVWNSNTDKWLLVEEVSRSYAKCKTVNDVYLYYNYSAADLISKPLYRMRRS